MISLEEWKSMCGTEKTLYLELNAKVIDCTLRRRPMYGRGLNDAKYKTKPKIDGVVVKCPAYASWSNMLKRAYDKKFHANQSTYAGVSVCDEWHSLSAFRLWWLENHVDGWHLDKDIVCDSRTYSPDTCIFVPRWLNNFTIDSGSARGDWPIGVSFRSDIGKFASHCNNPILMKFEHLGHFDNPIDASKAWLTRKLEIALELKPQMDGIDIRIYPRVVEIIGRSK